MEGWEELWEYEGIYEGVWRRSKSMRGCREQVMRCVESWDLICAGVDIFSGEMTGCVRESIHSVR